MYCFPLGKVLSTFQLYGVFNEESYMYMGTVDALEAVVFWVSSYNLQGL